MKKKFDINRQGYSIRCLLFCHDRERTAHSFRHVVLVTHGFGSSKDTAGTEHFGEHLTAKYKDYAVIAFDWPCHGADARKKLTVEECLTYLQIVTEYAREELQAEQIYNYSTSLGAYLTLRFLIEQGNPFTRIALRSTAVAIARTMLDRIPEPDQVKLKKGREIQIGFERKMKIDQGFLDSLQNFDLMNYGYFDYAEDILMIHGTQDQMIPLEQAEAFAENNVIRLIPIEGANHPFQNPNHMALAIHEIISFFHP